MARNERTRKAAGPASTDGNRAAHPLRIGWTRAPAPILALILAVYTLGGGTLTSWHWPTHVDIRLTVKRVVFTVGGTQPKCILNRLPFASVTVESFRSVQFSAVGLEAANQRQSVKRRASRAGRSPSPSKLR